MVFQIGQLILLSRKQDRNRSSVFGFVSFLSFSLQPNKVCLKNLVDSRLMFVYCAEKLPYSIKILLESAIRNCDEFQVKSKDVEKIIDWENTSPKQVEIPFKPARVLLQVCSGSKPLQW